MSKVKLPEEHRNELRRQGHDKAVKNITPETHTTMVALVEGKAVDVNDAFDALFEILASCSTRFGQSMTRRYASKGVLDAYRFLRTQAAPMPKTAAESAARAIGKAEEAQERAETERDEARAAHLELAHAVEQVLLTAETMVLSPDQKFFLGLENLLTPEQKAALAAYRKGTRRAKKSA